MKVAAGMAASVSVTIERVVGLIAGGGLKPLQDASIAVTRNKRKIGFSKRFTFRLPLVHRRKGPGVCVRRAQEEDAPSFFT